MQKFTWGVKNGVAPCRIAAGLPICRRTQSDGGHGREFVPIYKLLDRLSAVRNISNKIIVLKKGA